MSTKIFLRTPYNYDVDEASRTSGLACVDDSLTQQQFREECDINVILERFNVTGQLPENLNLPQSGDFTGIGSYHEALNAVINAQNEFMELPARIREKFDNNPQKLIDFLEDPSNREAADELGLTVPKPVSEPLGDKTGAGEPAAASGNQPTE